MKYYFYTLENILLYIIIIILYSRLKNKCYPITFHLFFKLQTDNSLS